MTNDRRGVPKVRPRSRAEIETLADAVAWSLYPALVERPGPMPIAQYFEFDLTAYFDIDVGTSNLLPPDVEGLGLDKGSRGRTELILRQDVYEAMWKGNQRARFTATHEAAHALLSHHKDMGTHLVEGAKPALYRRSDIPPYLDPEWQADVFAGTFLMPTKAVLALVQSGRADAPAVARIFLVSLPAAEVRLKYLRREGKIA